MLEPIDDLLGSAEYKLYITGVLLERALQDAVQDAVETSRMEKMTELSGDSQVLDVTIDVNGEKWSGAMPAHETLLEFIRVRLGLTGTKRSCESQVCGACTVLVDEQPISAAITSPARRTGNQVLTIEGLAQGEVLDPLQEAFLRNIGAQCGFCTPGQIMAAKALLLSNPAPTRQEIAEWLSGNICRCGAYPAIVASIQEAAAEMAARDPRR